MIIYKKMMEKEKKLSIAHLIKKILFLIKDFSKKLVMIDKMKM